MCRYFIYKDRPEDRVLRVLVEKANRIREDMGSVAKVLEGRVSTEAGRTPSLRSSRGGGRSSTPTVFRSWKGEQLDGTIRTTFPGCPTAPYGRSCKTS